MILAEFIAGVLQFLNPRSRRGWIVFVSLSELTISLILLSWFNA
jgi:hypothetical protein